MWVALCFLAKISSHRPTCKTTFARLTQSQAISQSFRVFISFRSKRDTTFFHFSKLFLYKMNHFQRLNEVKELKILFFAQRANTRKQASSRRSLPCDAWAPTAQNRASAVRERHVSTQKTGSYITERSRLPGLIVGPCPSEESLCCPACFSENRTSSACSRTRLLQVN